MMRDEFERQFDEEEVEFIPTAPPPGKTAIFSPSKAKEIQQATGADIVAGDLVFKSVRLTPLGAEINGPLEENDWWQIIGGLLKIESIIQLLIGDLLAFGQRTYRHSYREVAEKFGREVDTLYNYVWVASSVNFSLRNEKLNYTHYYHVAKLKPKEQKYWLNQALENNWSATKMLSSIQGKNNPPSIRSAPLDYFEHTIFDVSRRVFERTKGESRADMAAYLRRLADELERE